MRNRLAYGVRHRGAGAILAGVAGVLAVLCGTTLAVVGPSLRVAAATTETVTSCSDSGPGSLRQVVQGAPSGATVRFDVKCPTITLVSSITISKGLDIAGPGSSRLTVSGGKKGAIFVVASGNHVTISGLTLDQGLPSAGHAGALTNHGTTTLVDDNLVNNSGGGCSTYGGAILNTATLTVQASTISGNNVIRGSGIYNQKGATLRVANSTVDANLAGGGGTKIACFGQGGGLYNAGTATIVDSTFSGNTVGYKGDGGGIFNAGSTTIDNSTIADNVAGADGGGIYQDGLPTGPHVVIALDFVTIAYNRAASGGGLFAVNHDNAGGGTGIIFGANSGGDCGNSGPVGPHKGGVTWSIVSDSSCDQDITISGTYHVIEANPKLSTLAHNGGPTETIALSGASPALGFITQASACPAADQRGVDRLVPCDIGAWNGVPVTPPGYRLVGGDGGVFDFGSTPYKGGLHGQQLPAPIVGIANTNDAQGYWMVGSSGKVYPFGDAGGHGELVSAPGSPVVGIAATVDSRGYWLAEANADVVPFGDAQKFPASHPGSPIAAIAVDPQGDGYWLVTKAGKIYAFGAAKLYSEVSGEPRVNGTVAGMAALPNATGYWVMNSAGTVFAFGKARAYSLTGGNKPPAGSSFVGMASSPNGAGYQLVTATGYVEAFGSAPYLGDEHTAKLTKPIFGVSAYP